MGAWRTRVAVLALVALVAAGCGGDDDEAVPTEPPAVEPPPEEPAETAERTNEEAGYRLHYPADWHVNEGDVAEPCSFFDRDPFEVPEATEFIDVAVLVSREPVPLDAIVGEDPTRTVLDEKDTEIAGNRAVRIESEATGEGLLDAGTRFYQVVVEADGESIVLSTYEVGDLDYEGNKEAVDEPADSLELLG